MPIRAIENSRIFRRIADQLAALIDAGEYPRGARLPSERELAVCLGVSRPSVRGALIALELAGKIEIRTGSGAFVVGPPPIAAPPEEESPRELLRPRWTIEGEIAMEAARNAAPGDLEPIRAAVAAMEDPGEGERDPDRLDHAFHLGIARATHNGTLVSVAQTLWEHCRGPQWSRTAGHFHRPRVLAATLRDHRAILVALEARDGQRARTAMRVHLEHVEDELRRVWRPAPRARAAAVTGGAR
jgi:DNA-binding FadR family transcriptional regulator